MTEEKKSRIRRIRLQNRFIIFSVMLLLVIIVLGSLVYVSDNIRENDHFIIILFISVLVLLVAILFFFNLFIRRYLNSLNSTMESLELASNAKSIFLANMSHEIRTPMNAIIGITDIMMQSESLSEPIADGLDKISGSCDLLLGIINDILDFSKIEAGTLDVVPAQYYIASLINNSVHLNMLRINDKPIEFVLQINENIPAKMIGDELRVKQILNNILSNAFKFTEEGRVVLSVSFEPHADNGKVILVLSVEDTGHGMTDRQLETLFNEYTRFSSDKNRTIEGVGLGLTITKRLLELMDGDILVESEPDIGTTVTIKLPQVLVDEDLLGADVSENLSHFYVNYLKRKRQSRIEYDPMPYGSVLVVDDVETNLYVAVGLLKLYNLQIDTAMSGYEAIDKVKEGNTYDIIFMDHMMPGIDGIETARLIREEGYNDPIVALTANAVMGQADYFLDNGFDDFISKPIDLRRLHMSLIKFIRDSKPPEVIEAHSPLVDPLLIDSFIRDAVKSVNVLDELLSKPDFESDADLRMFIITIHGMKSSLRNIGEIKLSDTASRLEDLGRKNSRETIFKEAPVFLDDLRELLEKKQPKIEDVSEGDDPEDLIDKLLELKAKCVDYNRKGALGIIADIKTCSTRTRAVLEEIKEQVLRSDYDEAETSADQYADKIRQEKA